MNISSKYRTNRQLTRWLSSFLMLTCWFTLTACTTTTAPPPAPTDEDNGFTEEYRIGAGDALSISVWRNDDLSVQVPVRPDGMISVPLAGDVNVGNKTTSEVSSDITSKLAEFIRDPYVTVIVTDMGSADYRSRVRVTGAVRSPSSNPYRQGMTILDVVLEAGGLTEFANPSKAVLYRKNGERIDIDLRGILERGDMSTNHPLKQGDMVVVPERVF